MIVIQLRKHKDNNISALSLKDCEHQEIISGDFQVEVRMIVFSVLFEDRKWSYLSTGSQRSSEL